MILLIDNYDSFTYNLYQIVGQLYSDVKVVRNDEITLDDIERLKPEALLLSPGPGYPKTAGVTIDAVKRFSGRIPILGVCLGHQAIGEAFGGKTVPAKTLMHGKASTVNLDPRCPLFSGLPESTPVARYHSLITDGQSLPSCLKVTATDEDGQIMAVMHKEHPTFGVQFHPESILTGYGKQLLENFLGKVARLPVTSFGTPKAEIPPAKRNALKPYIFKAIDGENLSQEEAFEAMDCIMSGGATDAQIASFLTALRMKGETTDEITGFARVMRKNAVQVGHSTSVIDIVGTGGDMANTFNISTTASFVIAGANLKVAKHGNRSVSSKSGAADVLEALGININMTAPQAEQCIKECGLSFLFAPCFHSSMRFAAGPRREMGVRSVFNILGPLANPAFAQYIILGVYDEGLMETMARVLMNLGIKGAMIVHGCDGLDEITVSDKTRICEIRDGKIIKYDLDPRDYGIAFADKSTIVGGTAKDNAKITLDVLSGKEGPQRDIVVLNAACALYVARRADSVEDGIAMAKRSIDSGAAMQKLEALKELTSSFAKEGKRA